ncbi:MAG: hypothetical protein RR872_03855 [Mucinivorans sp.]
MKKNATYFSLAIITMACAILVSCNSNNSNPEPEPPVPTPAVKADVEYGIPDLYELHLLADVSITYIDATGKLLTENLASTPWSKEIKGITPPFTAKMTLTFKRKTDIKYNKSYKIGSGYSLLYKRGSDKGYSILNGSAISSFLSISSQKIEAMLTKLEATPKTYTLAVPILK